MISYTELYNFLKVSDNHSKSMSGGWDFTDHGAKRLGKGFIAMNDNLLQWPKMTISRADQLKSTNSVRYSYS